MAENTIIKYVQESHFSEEIKCLKDSDMHIKKTSPIVSLNPMLGEDNILRVGGRLKHGPFAYDAKHPVILPQNHHLVTLLVTYYHNMLKHTGKEYVLSAIRDKYWIIRARVVVRRVRRVCCICRRHKGSTGEQKMADLPMDRLEPCKPPFNSIGVGYFGPFEVKRGRSLVKRYGAVSSLV